MAHRLSIAGDGIEWTAEITPDGVRLRAPDATEPAPPVTIRDAGDGRFTIDAGGREHAAVAAASGDRVWISLNGRLFDFQVTSEHGARSGARDQDALIPPMSGTVVRVAVKPGDHVRRGDTLVVLEAMKMELPIRAPRDGVVTSVHVVEGQLAHTGQPVVELAR
jgi:biotin carboxyl carrier protein